jgi:ribosomal subunit interface protein
MQVPLQINFHDVPQSEALEARVREKAARLEAFYPRIMSCRVAIEAQHRHKHQGKHYAVRVDVRVPGREIVANRDHHEDVYVALREAFDAAKRQLEEFAKVQRGDVKTHLAPPAPLAPPGEGA